MRESFFIKDGYLAYKMNNNSTRHYFPIAGVNNINLILDTLNNNVNKVNIIEFPTENKTIFKVNGKEYLRIVYNKDDLLNLFVFNLNEECNQCC